MPPNIDDFNRGCALILGELYRNFPKPVPLKIDTLDANDDLDLSDKARVQERLDIYGATAVFLEEEGYLRFTGHAGNKALFSNVVLTSRGLAALNRTPDLMAARRKTAGELLLDLGKDLALQTASEALKQAVQVILGGADTPASPGLR